MKRERKLVLDEYDLVTVELALHYMDGRGGMNAFRSDNDYYYLHQKVLKALKGWRP